VPRDESREFQEAVVRARARLDDLSPLLVVANDIDRSLELAPDAEAEEDSTV
jgi:hypothetical protein